MASAGARAYKGVWGLCPQWGPGAKPLVRGSGGQSPPEAESFLLTRKAILLRIWHVYCFILKLSCRPHKNDEIFKTSLKCISPSIVIFLQCCTVQISILVLQCISLCHT
jgi:hypothetical protein